MQNRKNLDADFLPKQAPVPKKEAGGIDWDWARVAAITIVEVGDCHD